MSSREERIALAHRRRLDVATWSSPSARGALEIVAGLHATTGFGLAVVNLLWQDSLIPVAVAGDDTVREQMLGVGLDAQRMFDEFDRRSPLGRLRRVHFHDLHDDIEKVGPISATSSDPDAWQPFDLLVGPLFDSRGDRLGFLVMDAPEDGRRPDETRVAALDGFVRQVERILDLARETHEVELRMRTSEAARKIIRLAATTTLDVREALSQTRSALVEAMDCDLLVVRVDDSPSPVEAMGLGDEVPQRLIGATSDLAMELWEQHTAYVYGSAIDDPRLEAAIRTLLQEKGSRSPNVMVLPLGWDAECYGYMVVGRKDELRLFRSEDVVAATGIAADLSVLVRSVRQSEREQELVDRLRNLADARAQMIATVSHELKNPLAVMLGHTDLMLADDPPSTESLQAISRAAQRMRGLVGDLLELAGLDEVATSKVCRVDVRRVMQDVVQSLGLQAERDEVKVVCHSEALAPTGVHLHGHDKELLQVVTNLVDNAVKYTEPGGKVEVAADLIDGELAVSVSDTGIGIAPGDVERLFTEFFRSSNPRAWQRPGTGLGLTITQRLVERFGGTIDVESRVGEGSTFLVRIPVVLSEDG